MITESDVPVVEEVTSSSHPAIPSGLKVTPDTSPPPPFNLRIVNASDTLATSSSHKVTYTCPVIKWAGYTYWAYSYIDDRASVAIVAYDSAGKAAQGWEKTGARDVRRITVDTAAKTVTFFGESNRTIEMTWDELRPIPLVEQSLQDMRSSVSEPLRSLHDEIDAMDAMVDQMVDELENATQQIQQSTDISLADLTVATMKLGNPQSKVEMLKGVVKTMEKQIRKAAQSLQKQ